MSRWALPWPATFLCLVLHAAPAMGQEAGRAPSALSRDALMVEAALEPELVVSVRYLRRLAGGGSSGGLHAGVGLKLPVYLMGRGSGRVDLLARGRWVGGTGLGVTTTSSVYLARSDNRSGTMHGLGVEVRAAPGYHGELWSVSADLGWQGTLLTHIRHSELVGETFEERHPGAESMDGPVDGWYGSTAHRFRIGVAGARRLTDAFSLRLAAGTLFSRQRQGLFVSFAHGQVPAYLEVSARTAW